MLEAALDHYGRADVVIMAAAVADFTPRYKFPGRKIKKRGGPSSLELESTRDILKFLSRQPGKKDRILVGFALETENLIANARLKMKEKKLDYIVANDTSTFGEDRCRLSLIARSGKVEEFPLLSKPVAANHLLDLIKNW